MRSWSRVKFHNLGLILGMAFRLQQCGKGAKDRNQKLKIFEAKSYFWGSCRGKPGT